MSLIKTEKIDHWRVSSPAYRHHVRTDTCGQTVIKKKHLYNTSGKNIVSTASLLHLGPTLTNTSINPAISAHCQRTLSVLGIEVCRTRPRREVVGGKVSLEINKTRVDPPGMGRDKSSRC